MNTPSLSPAERAPELREVFDRLAAGRTLGRRATHALFRRVVAGELADFELSALLVALKVHGETPAEIAGAARALREAATPFPRPAGSLCDCCGTGGDGLQTVNISTAVAFVAAACGLRVVKHGNRSISSRCGSADVLEECGVALHLSPEEARRALDETGICFLFAPDYHPGLRHCMPVRRALRTRTILNLVGPLLNPAQPDVQLLGVYEPRLVTPVAETLRLLGCRRALVVHGAGLDEVALHGATRAAFLEDGRVRELLIRPRDAGLREVPIEALAGGDPADNGRWLERTLAGEGAPAHADAVAINAGALLWVAGRAPDLAAGTAHAREVLESAAPRARLQALVEAGRGAHGASPGEDAA